MCVQAMATGEEHKLRAALAALAEAEQSGAAVGAETGQVTQPEPEAAPALRPELDKLRQSDDLLEDFFGGEQGPAFTTEHDTSPVAAVVAGGAGSIASDVDPWVLLSPTEQPSAPLSNSGKSLETREGGGDAVIVSEAADILADFFGSWEMISSADSPQQSEASPQRADEREPQPEPDQQTELKREPEQQPTGNLLEGFFGREQPAAAAQASTSPTSAPGASTADPLSDFFS